MESVLRQTYESFRDFLRQALAGVLAQDPGSEEMEIVLVDDGSPGFDPDDLLDATTRNRVTCVRQDHAGIGQNWNACIRRARGRRVHILHQDDLVLPGFYERLRAGCETAPSVVAAFCRDVVIDGHGARKWGQVRIRDTAGIVDDWVEHVFVGLHLRAPALVARREIYEALGGFRLDLDYALDWTCGSASPPPIRCGTSPKCSPAIAAIVSPRPSGTCAPERTSPRSAAASSCRATTCRRRLPPR
jgi:glycosyltransferase involved in cell wall biosynthesis